MAAGKKKKKRAMRKQRVQAARRIEKSPSTKHTDTQPTTSTTKKPNPLQKNTPDHATQQRLQRARKLGISISDHVSADTAERLIDEHETISQYVRDLWRIIVEHTPEPQPSTHATGLDPRNNLPLHNALNRFVANLMENDSTLVAATLVAQQQRNQNHSSNNTQDPPYKAVQKALRIAFKDQLPPSGLLAKLRRSS